VNIVLTRLDAIGDLILSTAGIKAIRNSWPAAKISLVCNQYNSIVMKNSTDIDELHIIDKKNCQMIVECAFRFLHADLAIAMAPCIEDLTFVLLTKAKERIGYTFLDFEKGQLVETNLTKMLIPTAYPAVYAAYLPNPVDHEVEQVLRLVQSAGGNIDGSELSIVLSQEDYRCVDHVPDRCILVPLCPRWLWGGGTPETLAELINKLRQFNRPIVITFNEQCASLAEKLAHKAKIDMVIGGLTFTQWAAIFPKAACVVTVNSSATHVASAFKRPTVLILENAWFHIDRQKWAPYKCPSVVLRKPESATEEAINDLNESVVSAVEGLLSEVYGTV
jgi:ADP-heptose:LPS heptosyltransferase